MHDPLILAEAALLRRSLLLTSDESRHAIDAGEVYVVLPEHQWWEAHPKWLEGKPVEDEFAYSSATNDTWLTVPELQALLP